MVSVLDTDFYLLTMQCAILKLYPRARAKYEFINRDKTKFPENFGVELRNKIKNEICKRTLKPKEKEFLSTKVGRFLDPAYLDFLEGYRFNDE
jgi:nicotinate phosphoribosyltransferase